MVITPNEILGSIITTMVEIGLGGDKKFILEVPLMARSCGTLHKLQSHRMRSLQTRPSHKEQADH
jgi:hypothetical protein